jgi:hypothetical protein
MKCSSPYDTPTARCARCDRMYLRHIEEGEDVRPMHPGQGSLVACVVQYIVDKLSVRIRFNAIFEREKRERGRRKEGSRDEAREERKRRKGKKILGG